MTFAVPASERTPQSLLKEQEAFLKAAMEIDPDIKVIYKYKMVLNAFALLVDLLYLPSIILKFNVSK